MKKLFLAIIIISLPIFAEYKQWDIVDNITWQDSDGGSLVSRDL